ncbi:MAG: bifunctional DNA-formamidopyrimidine glycosylase/DNA-(apurinic or apyrimidinic site) lyase [Chryseobacterium sp.]|nr:MAG: bifunctional DNA-formamidopyrimidine glycosylase/DNA-(apurinic or apyrimidinic site) lyase [Chryseobacterium sp.]
MVPELPEVETVKRGLAKLIISKKVKSVTSDNPKSFPNPPHDVSQFLVGASITAVRRRAKVLLIDLSTEYTLVIHLKMTGQLVFVGDERFGAGHPNDSLVNGLPDKSTRVVFEFSDGSHLFFNDQRKFGWVKLIPSEEVANLPFMQKVGPEPLEDNFTVELFYTRLQRRKNTTIKAAILDQTVLAGVGNIYADEGLWGACIHPSTRVKDVPRAAIDDLWRELREVMGLAIEKGGSSNHTYINAEGKKGSYMDFARVFRRDGEMCLRHPDVEITKLKVAGRGTHICPVCQVQSEV